MDIRDCENLGCTQSVCNFKRPEFKLEEKYKDCKECCLFCLHCYQEDMLRNLDPFIFFVFKEKYKDVF